MLTPIENYHDLAKAIGIPNSFYFKREDLHPYGSHKGRSIPVMIETYYTGGDRRFAVSSSGNAALAAALYIKELGERKKEKGGGPDIELTIFVGNHVAPHKLEKLRKLSGEHIRILKKERPLQALTQATSEGWRSLRQSTDDTALIGYKSLAEELAEIRDLGAVFIGTSSGTTSQALATYFLKKEGESGPINCPQIHIVQTSSCHPIADAFETFEVPEELSIADAIVDITAKRKQKLVPLIEKTGGRAWVATNDDIRAAQELVSKHTGVDISTNSALSVAGVMKAVYVGHEINGAIVCLICGD